MSPTCPIKSFIQLRREKKKREHVKTELTQLVLSFIVTYIFATVDLWRRSECVFGF